MYDVKGSFATVCNKEMVDLDPLTEVDQSDLKKLISEHTNQTNSTVGAFILNDFENQVRNFIKVFPKDYKKVMEQQKQKTTLSVQA